MEEVPIVIGNTLVDEETHIPTPVVDDVRDEAVAVIDEATAEAANIITQARIAAEQCLHEAQQQVAIIKQQAHDDGRQQGYQEGQQAGHQEGLIQGQQIGRAEMEQVIADAIAQSRKILDASEHESEAMMFAAERQIVDIALAVARKIMAYEIAENPMVVLPMVKAALHKVSDQEEVVIRVSVDDFDSVLMAKKDLQTMVGRENALKIIVDHTIESGSCIIDTSYGEVDARVDTQFETIKKALQGVA